MMDYSSIDVEDLVLKLDLSNAKLTNSGEEINFSCFGAEHMHGDETPSAYINVETTAWFCHGCHRRGSAVNLVMEIQDVSRATAERSLRDWYGIEFDEPAGGSMVAETEARFRPVVEELPPLPPPPGWLVATSLAWSDPPEPFMSYMLDRGFAAETLEHWQIGYDYLSNRITIPVFDIEGNLVGIKGRDWTGQREPKYLILGDRPGRTMYGFAPYEAAQVVFGLHRAREIKTVVLCEGELNAVALQQLGALRPIATGMSYFSERHAQLIAREADEVIVYYDIGQAGHEGTWGHRDASGQYRPGVVQRLEPYVRVRVAEPLDEDPAELVSFDRGEEAQNVIRSARSSLDFSIVFR